MADTQPAPHAAIVLAGGRSARLGGVPKAELELAGRSLLQCAVDAAAPSLLTVVVGPPTELAGHGAVRFVRENPPFGGPVRGLAAGIGELCAHLPAALAAARDLPVLLLGCDQPFAAEATGALLAALAAHPGAQGAIALDESGQRQPLLACARLGALADAVAQLDLAGDGKTPSLRRVIGALHLVDVTPPARASYDIDTWQAAARVGARPPDGRHGAGLVQDASTTDPVMRRRGPGASAAIVPGSNATGTHEGRGTMTTPAELEPWAAALRADLQLPEDAPIDIEAILNLTGTVAHAVARPAAPLSAYLIGVAVGRGASLPDAIEATEAAARRWAGPKA